MNVQNINRLLTGKPVKVLCVSNDRSSKAMKGKYGKDNQLKENGTIKEGDYVKVVWDILMSYSILYCCSSII